MNRGLRPHVGVTSIAVNPHNRQQIVAGVYAREGIYRSNDGGITWQVDSDNVSRQPVFALLFDPVKPNRLWLASADGLYWQITSGNAQSSAWRRVASWPLARAAFSLHATSDGTILATGAHPAIWSSTDGEEWTQLAPLSDEPFAILSVAEAAGHVLLAGSDGAGLFISRDDGASWQQISDIGKTFVAAIWVAPWNERLILARTRKGLYRSVDGASTWHPVGSELAERVDSIAGIEHNQVIYLGMSSGEIFRSLDEGASWQKWGNGLDRDGLFYTLWVDTKDVSTFLAGTQHALYRSEDGARTWRSVADVGTVQAASLTQTPDGTLYLGNRDGVAVSKDRGETWQAGSEGLPPRTVLSLAQAPGASDKASGMLYAATEGDGIYAAQTSDLVWRQIGQDNRIIPDFAIDPFNPRRFFARLAYERIYVSEDAGHSWFGQWSGMSTETEIMSVALSPHEPDLLYAGGVVDTFKSTDGGNSWRRIGEEMSGQSIFHVSVDRANPDVVYAGVTKGLYRSEDAGESWALWGQGLQDVTVTALAFHPSQRDIIYAGTKYRGIYESGDGGGTWLPGASAINTTSVRQLVVDVDGRWLYAATDQGFWRAALIQE